MNLEFDRYGIELSFYEEQNIKEGFSYSTDDYVLLTGIDFGMGTFIFEHRVNEYLKRGYELQSFTDISKKSYIQALRKVK